MTQQFNATYQGGVLHPAEGVDLPLQDGDSVRVTIATTQSKAAADVVRLAQSVYEGLSPDEVVEIERIATDRSNFFGGRSDTDE